MGYYVVGKLRSRLHESGPSASDFMTNFRELHARGELSDEEFRTIKAKLAAKLQEQVKQQKSEA
ncbi:MAG TPA: SHOCT domain-containing protein [Pirellulales bacterium]|nr:SHOCT domain-containing protein [Pirellulales bacterium]